MKGTIRELLNGQVQTSYTVSLDRPLTIGRGAMCDIRIGNGLDEKIAQGISRIQATVILGDDGDLYLIDGTIDRKSRNGVWHNGKPITTPFRLVAGADLYLYNSAGEVTETTTNQGGVIELLLDRPMDSQETYAGGLLLEVLQERIDELTKQVALMANRDTQIEQRIDALTAQVTTHADARSQIDQQQTALIQGLDKRLRKSVAAALVVMAIAFVTFTLSGEASSEERSEWRKTLVQIVQVLAGVGVAGVGVKLNSDANPKDTHV
jgi:pSer/pThr/pTyr-binding forkhead associated (FHA) protein